MKYVYPALGNDARLYPYDELDVDFHSSTITEDRDVQATKNLLKGIFIYWLQYFIQNGNPFIMSYVLLAKETFNNKLDTPWKGLTDGLLPVNAMVATVDQNKFNGLSAGIVTRNEAFYVDDLNVSNPNIDDISNDDGAMLFNFNVLVSEYFVKPIYEHVLSSINPGFTFDASPYNPKIIDNGKSCYCEVADHDRGKIFAEVYKSHFTISSKQDADNHKVRLNYDGFLHINNDSKDSLKMTWAYGVDVILSKNGSSILKINPDDKVSTKVLEKGGFYGDWDKEIKRVSNALQKGIGNGVSFPIKGFLLPSGEDLAFRNPNIIKPNMTLSTEITKSH